MAGGGGGGCGTGGAPGAGGGGGANGANWSCVKPPARHRQAEQLEEPLA